MLSPTQTASYPARSASRAMRQHMATSGRRTDSMTTPRVGMRTPSRMARSLSDDELTRTPLLDGRRPAGARCRDQERDRTRGGLAMNLSRRGLLGLAAGLTGASVIGPAAGLLDPATAQAPKRGGVFRIRGEDPVSGLDPHLVVNHHRIATNLS